MHNFHPIFPYLSAVNYIPYTQDIRNIYVGYTQDNRVVNLRIPYLPPAFYLFLSAFFLETTSLPFRYHSVTTILPSSTFPVPSYLSSAQLPNILHLQRSNLPTTGAQRRSTAKRTTTCHPPPVKCSALIRRVSPPLYPTLFTFLLKNLHTCKFFCTFVPESYAGGKYVLRKAFRNGSFLGRFRTYLNSVY